MYVARLPQSGLGDIVIRIQAVLVIAISVLSVASGTARLESLTLSVDVDADRATYSVSVEQRAWLTGGTIAFREAASWHVAGRNLTIVSTVNDNGIDDALGPYARISLTWVSDTDDGTKFVTSFRSFKEIDALAFDQYFPTGAANTSVGDTNDVFPHFLRFLRDLPSRLTFFRSRMYLPSLSMGSGQTEPHAPSMVAVPCQVFR
eukprot:Opistho-2@17611